MELTPRRQALINARLAESRGLMVDAAFELNDLVRLALAASKEKDSRVYYPMDPVNESTRQWAGLSKRLTALAQHVEQVSTRMRVLPFDPEAPSSTDPAIDPPK